MGPGLSGRDQGAGNRFEDVSEALSASNGGFRSLDQLGLPTTLPRLVAFFDVFVDILWVSHRSLWVSHRFFVTNPLFAENRW